MRFAARARIVMEGTADRRGGPPPRGAPDTDVTVVSLAPLPAVTSPGAALVPYAPSPGTSTEQTIVSMTRLVLGAVDLAAAAFASILERSSAVPLSLREGAASSLPSPISAAAGRRPDGRPASSWQVCG
jgi:hypothetical protein